MHYQGTLHFEKFGSGGDTIVLLHGWGHSIDNVRGLAKILAWQHTVYAVDLPGFGKSDPPPESWGTADYAICIEEFMAAEGIAQATLCGHSFGGRVSIQLTARAPEKVKKLILLNSSGLPPVRPWDAQIRIRILRYIAKALKFIDATTGTAFFKNNFAPRFGSADYKKAGELRSVFVRTVNEDLTPQALAVKARTLLLWGERDTETPVALGVALKSLIHNSHMVVLAGKGHEPFQDVGSHLCAYHIFSFLAGDNA